MEIHPLVSGSDHFPVREERQADSRQILPDRVSLGESKEIKGFSTFSMQPSGSVLLNVAPAGNLICSATAAVMAGAGSSTVASQLEELGRNNVEFFLRRKFYIPKLMDDKKEITHQEAAQILTSGDDDTKNRLQARVDRKTVIESLKEEDVRELMAFNDLDKSISLPQKSLADFLRSAKGGQYIDVGTEGGEVRGAYGAYKYLTSGNAGATPIHITCNGEKMMSFTADDCKNVSSLASEFKSWQSIISRIGHYRELIAAVREPLTGVSLDERGDLAAEIYTRVVNRSGYYRYEAVLNEYQNIAAKTGGGPEFLRLGKLYLQMLDANKIPLSSESCCSGFDLLHSRLKDNPDELSHFMDRLTNGSNIATEVKIFEKLPQPVKQGDYQNMTALFSPPGFWSAEQVELATKSPGAGSLAGRIEILRGIHRHAKYYNNDSYRWQYATRAYEHMMQKTGETPEFERLGKLFVQMLDTRGKDEWEEGSLKGFDLIQSRFADHPDEFACFIELIKNGFDPPSAVKIFELLPQPVNQGDYQKAAATFGDGGTWDEDRVAYVMSHNPEIPLQERIDLIKGIYPHAKRYNNDSYRWQQVVYAYEHIQQKTNGGADMVRLGKLFVKMLDARGRDDWEADCTAGFDLIQSRFADHPEELNCFLGLLNKGFDITSAVKIFELLPQPVNPGDYQKVASTFGDGDIWNTDGVVYAMSHNPEISLQDRVDLIRGMHPHSKRYDRDSYRWQQITYGYQYIQEKTGGGAELVRLGKLYLQMLDARGKDEWEDSYINGFDFIQSRLADHPDELSTFLELLKRGIDIKAALRIFELLPQPVNQGDYQKAAAHFTGSDFWTEDRIPLVMKDLGGVSLQDKIDLVKGIYPHARCYNRDDYRWQYAEKAYNYIQEKTGGGPAFVSTGKMFIEMLQAHGKDDWEDVYLKGFDLIQSRFADHPDEFACFLALITKGFDILSAVKIFEGLVQPVQQDDYAKAAAHFQDPRIWAADRVELVMQPEGTSTLAERIDLLKELFGIQKVDGEYYRWEYAKQAYSAFTEKAGSSPDFVALGKLATEMLDTQEYYFHKDIFQRGLSLIMSRLKDHPDEFSAFIDLIKNQFTIPVAVKIFEQLPQPVNRGDYEKAAGCFREGKFWNEERVSFVMSEYPAFSLQDKVNLVMDMEPHEADDNGHKSWENTLADIEYVKDMSRGDADFLEKLTLYAELLKANGLRIRTRQYRKGFEFLLAEKQRMPDRYQSFLWILSGAHNVKTARKIYDAIQEPVQDEPYDVRARAAAALAKYTDFKVKFGILCRNVLPGETLEDAALLLSSIARFFDNEKPDELEKYLQKLYTLKGNVNSADIADLANVFSCYCEKELPEAMELLKNPVQGETFRERKDVLVGQFKQRYEGNESYYKEVLNDYNSMAKGILSGEPLPSGAERFNRIWDSIAKSGVTKQGQIHANTRDVYEFFGDGMRTGSLGGRSFNDLLAEFQEELLFTKDVAKAKEHIMLKYQKGVNGEILEEDEQIVIGGVKLNKKR